MLATAEPVATIDRPDPKDHVGLLVSVARRVFRSDDPQGLELGDLISQGTPALMKAAKCWGPERGIPFGHYAAKGIARAMRQARAQWTRLPVQAMPETERVDESTPDKDAGMVQEDRKKVVQRLLGILDARGRRIVELRCGFADGRPRRMAEIAADLGLHPAYATSIYSSAIAEMREYAAANGIDATILG